MKEDIKVLEKRVNFCKNNKECREELKQCFGCTFEIEEIQAIENLINRNKELEKENIKLHTEIAEVVYWESSPVEQIKQDYIPKSKVREKIEKIEKQGIWIDEDYYYNEELGEEYPICKKEFTKEELEEVVIDILKELQEGDK